MDLKKQKKLTINLFAGIHDGDRYDSIGLTWRKIKVKKIIINNSFFYTNTKELNGNGKWNYTEYEFCFEILTHIWVSHMVLIATFTERLCHNYLWCAVNSRICEELCTIVTIEFAFYKFSVFILLFSWIKPKCNEKKAWNFFKVPAYSISF